jgi:hypothetical protein
VIITKTMTKTYNIKFYPEAMPDIKWGDFRRIRENHGLSINKFEKCFCCGRAFSDGETVVVVSVNNGVGNCLACQSCLVKEQREVAGK